MAVGITGNDLFFWRSASFWTTTHDIRRSLPGEVPNNDVTGVPRNYINWFPVLADKKFGNH